MKKGISGGEESTRKDSYLWKSEMSSDCVQQVHIKQKIGSHLERI